VSEAAVLVIAGVRRRTRRRGGLVAGLLVASLVAAMALRVLGGDYTVTAPDFVRILGGTEIPGASFIVMESKLPRAVLGALAGAAFGLGGAIFQAALRNPLASPDLIGISAGASAAAAFAIITLGLTGLAVSAFAIGGALLVAALIAACAGPGGYRLVLVGVAFTAVLVAVIQHLLARATVFDAQEALVWLTGSLNEASWPATGRLSACLAVLLPATGLCARRLRIAALGEELGAGLGEPAGRVRVPLVLAVLLVATATAATGPIAFVSLLAGPIARRLHGGQHALLGAALVGSVVVVLADHVAAYGLDGVNLPVGVVTGALGAPFLLWLLVLDRSRTS
jgi:iron complex transport system permease protein